MEVDKAVGLFLAHLRLERGATPATLAAYGGDLNRYAGFLNGAQNGGAVTAGGKLVTDIVPDDGRNFVRYLRGEGGGPGLSPTSTARAVSAVRAFHRFLVDEGMVGQSVVADLKPPKTPERLPKALTVEQVDALLAQVGVDGPLGLRDRAVLELLYASGLRISELTSLDVDDAVAHAGLLRVKGKGGKWRQVPVGKPAAAAVDAYLVRARPALASRAALGTRAASATKPASGGRVSASRAGLATKPASGAKSTPALFLGARGGRLSRQAAWEIVRDAAAAAGLASLVSPHTLRHSFATHLLQGGADIRVVQELLGHASVTTTQLYTRVTPDMLREVYAASHPRARA